MLLAAAGLLPDLSPFDAGHDTRAAGRLLEGVVAALVSVALLAVTFALPPVVALVGLVALVAMLVSFLCAGVTAAPRGVALHSSSSPEAAAWRSLD